MATTLAPASTSGAAIYREHSMLQHPHHIIDHHLKTTSNLMHWKLIHRCSPIIFSSKSTSSTTVVHHMPRYGTGFYRRITIIVWRKSTILSMSLNRVEEAFSTN